MDEHTEIYIKEKLVAFIRNKFVLEGHPDLIEQKVIDLAVQLYEMFEEFKGYPQK